MTYVKINVLKPSNNAGKGSDVKGRAYIFDWGEVESGYGRDSAGVVMPGTMVFKSGCFVQMLEFTKSTIKNTSKTEGDPDKRGILQGCEFEHPGSSQDIREFRSYWMNRDIGIIFEHCEGDTPDDLYGTPCAPLQLDFSAEESKDSNHTTFTFASTNKGPDVAIYEGSMDLGSTNLIVAGDTEIDLDDGPGIYETQDHSASVEIATIANAVHLMVFTVLGGGGDNPPTIPAGTVFQLKDGAPWTALEGATITFKVYKNGASSYIAVEQART